MKKIILVLSIFLLTSCSNNFLVDNENNSEKKLATNNFDLIPFEYEIDFEENSSFNSIYEGKLYDNKKIIGGAGKFSTFTNPNNKKNLQDYFVNQNEKSYIELFYDTRTLELSITELKELFFNNKLEVHVIEKQFDNGFNIRVYDILKKPLDPSIGSYRFIQTWDDKNIYSQSITSNLESFTENIMPINNSDFNKLIIWAYNVGIPNDIRSEIHFWEFKNNKWQLTNLDLEENINYGSATQAEDENGNQIFELTTDIIYYDDGISFGYTEIYSQNIKKLYNRFSVIEKDKSFKISNFTIEDMFIEYKILN